MPPGHHELTWSIHRAFVVHFTATRGPARRRFRGRVEHLSTGESAHFSSLEKLLAFFDSPFETGRHASGADDDESWIRSGKREPNN
jgi:hypothetical protein